MGIRPIDDAAARGCWLVYDKDGILIDSRKEAPPPVGSQMGISGRSLRVTVTFVDHEAQKVGVTPNPTQT